MGQQRYLLFVIVCSSIVNYSISEMLMRTSQAKFFPPDAEPPEETVELWMGRTAVPQAKNDITTNLECDMDGWRHSDTGRGRLHALVDVLKCLRCQRSLAVGQHVTDQCLQAHCDRKCKGNKVCQENCRQMDKSQQSSEGNHLTEREMGGDGEGRSQGLVGVDRRQLLTLQATDPKRSASSFASEYMTRDSGFSPARAGNEVRNLSLHKPQPHMMNHVMNKRYRLGLYDCISSYCGKLSGPDRQLCIINYCHRSSTLKM